MNGSIAARKTSTPSRLDTKDIQTMIDHYRFDQYSSSDKMFCKKYVVEDIAKRFGHTVYPIFVEEMIAKAYPNHEIVSIRGRNGGTYLRPKNSPTNRLDTKAALAILDKEDKEDDAVIKAAEERKHKRAEKRTAVLAAEKAFSILSNFA